MGKKGRVVVFARAPELGKVKTRLASTIGDAQALEVYEQLLQRTVQLSQNIAESESDMFFPPVIYGEGNLNQLLAYSSGLSVRQQVDGDLGVKMQTAAAAELHECSWVILIGSDCAVLTADYLRTAAKRLIAGDEVVVGPAEDGGYVLLGLNQVPTIIFKEMHWGSNSVLQTTLSRLDSLRLRYSQLTTLWDVDTHKDLRRWKSAD